MVMRSTSFRKSARRTVKGSLTRFVSIAVISFLGAGVFAGLAATSPNMKRAGDAYYDAQNVMDVRLLSTYGFSDEDVKAIRNTDGVSGVMASCFVDATGTVGDKDYTFRIDEFPSLHDPSDADYMNRLKLVSGKLPQKENEAVIIRPSTGLKNIALGSKISLKTDFTSKLSDTIGRTEYTIVGIAESPYYLSFMQGSTSVGSGKLDYILYVPQKDFVVDGYTDLYATVKGAKPFNTFADDYFYQTNAVVNRLKTLAKVREPLRYGEFESSLSDAKQRYSDSEKEADDKLADAKAKLDEGRSGLNDAKAKYADGLAQYKNQKADADRKLSDAKARLDNAAAQISAGEKELAAKRSEFQSAESRLKTARAKLDSGRTGYNGQARKLAAGKATLTENKRALDKAQKQYDSNAAAAQNATGMTIKQIEAALPSMKTQLDASEKQYESLSQLAQLKAARDAATDPQRYAMWNVRYQTARKAAGLSEAQAAEQIARLGLVKAQIDAARRQYDQLTALVAAKNSLAGKQEEYQAAASRITAEEAQLAAAGQTLETGEKEYAAKTAELESAGRQIRQAENRLAPAKQSYAAGLSEYNGQRASAKKKLAEAKAKLDSAAVKIRNGKTELADRQKEYEEKKAEADTKLADAKRKIEDAEKELSGLGEPKWYVLDRHMDQSFLTYEGDTNRMRDLATVFPVVFFLVAALVCLTTMTRMVDEDRTLIGTFKALGYSNGQIAGRYLKYAASASLIGSVTGVCLGFWLLPTIIWDAYRIVFALPDMTPAFYFGIAAMSIFATVFIITLSTGIAAKNSLQESPADLMRPKAPKSGKRVFLEYVKPVWSQLSFSKKVTVRNLGLNKKRLAMTLIGIIGCTALVVTAFGAKNAVRTILDGQFGRIFHYNVSVGFNGGEPSAKLTSLLSNGAYFKKSAEVLSKSAEASPKSNENDTYDIDVVSPKDGKNFADYVTLSDPQGRQLSLREDSAVITEKLAMNLHAGVGDTIMVKDLDENERHAVTVAGITKNYTFNYVYLGKTAYQKAFRKAPAYNQFFAIKADGLADDQIKTYLSRASDVGVISFTDDLMGNIRTSVKSVDNIIWILILAAGLLAFVVLYNLTNINIGERQRELATLKVLGFYDRETYSYIFRETWILSIIGCLFGLFAGVFLYRAVVATVEPDMILLTRDLTWQGYLGAAVLTMLFTWIVNQCMKPRIRNIDMLESLKSVD